MPNNMKKAGMNYEYGGGFTNGAGDGDVTPTRARMDQMSKGGGLMGYMNGGDVLNPNTMGYGGSMKKKKK